MGKERIKANNPHLAVNIITKSLDRNSDHSTKEQAVAIIRALHEAGLKISPF